MGSDNYPLSEPKQGRHCRRASEIENAWCCRGATRYFASLGTINLALSPRFFQQRAPLLLIRLYGPRASRDGVCPTDALRHLL
jgi:hypothetical protein